MERYGQDDNRRNVFREEKYMGDTNIDYDEKFGITTVVSRNNCQKVILRRDHT